VTTGAGKAGKARKISLFLNLGWKSWKTSTIFR